MAKKHVQLLQARPEYHNNIDINQATDLIIAALTTLGEKELKDEKGGFARGFMIIRQSSTQSEADSIEKDSPTHAFAITTLGRNPINDEPSALDFRFEIQPNDTIKCIELPPELKQSFPAVFPNLDSLLKQFQLFSYFPITREFAKKVSSAKAEVKEEAPTVSPSLAIDHTPLIDECALRQLFSVKHKYKECLRLDHEKHKANAVNNSNREMVCFTPKSARKFPTFSSRSVDISTDFGMRSAAQLAYNTWRLALRHSDDIDAALWYLNLETEKELWKMEQTTLCLAGEKFTSYRDLNEIRLPDPLFGDDENQYFSIESKDEMSERQCRLIQLFRERLPSRVDLGVAADLKRAKDVSARLDQFMSSFLSKDTRRIVMEYTNWPWLAFFSKKSAELKQSERLLMGLDSRPISGPINEDSEEFKKPVTVYDLEKQAKRYLAGNKSGEPIPKSLNARGKLTEEEKTRYFRRRV